MNPIRHPGKFNPNHSDYKHKNITDKYEFIGLEQKQKQNKQNQEVLYSEKE